ncbi:hypothetical protein D3C84_1048390 [compost metagenome]
MTVSGIRRCIRQGDAGQRIEIAQTGPGQFQAQIQGTEVHWIGQRTGKLDAGVGDLHVRL